MTFKTFYQSDEDTSVQSDEETWSDQQKGKYNEKDKE